MKGLIQTAVLRPVGVAIIYLAIVMLGLVGFRQLAVDLLPDVDVPRISITTQYEGVSPEEIETLVTRPIEQATSTIEGVERLEATSSEGLSRVQLQFAWGVPLDQALDDVRVAIDRVRAALPEGATQPNVHKFDLSSVPVAFLGLTGTGDPRRLKYLAEDELSRALERVPGVASVDVQGGRDREIRVALDGARLSALGISATQVAAALARENRTVSAGDMRDGGRDVVVRTAGEFESLDDIAGVVVAARDANPILVRDLGKVEDSIRRVRSELWIDGAPGIRLRVYKQSGANTVEVVKAVRAELERINADYAGRAQLTVIWDSSEYIKSAVSNVSQGASLGAALAVLVLLFFLRSLRATLVVAAAIPVSIVATFGVMFFRGMTLNVVSFGALALSIGMLVDSAIVILENIHRKGADGLAPKEAATQGAGEVGSAVTAGAITTIAVFVPVVFMGGFVGVLFSEMAEVVTFSLACSLLVALTLVPMIAARLMSQRRLAASPGVAARASDAIGRFLARADAAYGRLIGASLTAPWAVVLGALVVFASSMMFAKRIGVELVPQADEGRIDISLELPVGTPLETTSGVMMEAERRVRGALRQGELAHVVTTAGPENWWRPGGSNEGKIELSLTSRDERLRTSAEIEGSVRKSLDGIAAARLQIRQSTSNILTRIIRRGEDRLAVDIRGHDLEKADAIAREVVALMRETRGVTFARPDRELGQPERVIHVDRARAAELGLGSAEVAAAVEHYVLGRVATRYRDQGDEFDVRVQLAESERERLEQLPDMPILAPDGRRVALRSLVEISERKGPSSISRLDQERVLRVNGGTAAGLPLGEVAAAIKARLGALETPEGFTVTVAGELEGQDEAFSTFLIGILLAVFLVYAAMAVQFESVRHPLVVMASVPFAFTGVVAALVISGTTFNMNSGLGVIVLVGVAVNNAIVLVDYTNVLRREHGFELRQAVIAAGTRRLRPILMTTLTTVLGLLPLALAAGDGSETQAPLARTVLGGLLACTVVTLLLLPCVYYLVEKRQARALAPGTAPAPSGEDSVATAE
ncbi:MAG: efflux RND transporter permease subunit [Myxococcales bacterium]|nr:efflux RND transporter permease subunit [Myxococcales bacterium]